MIVLGTNVLSELLRPRSTTRATTVLVRNMIVQSRAHSLIYYALRKCVA